MLSVADLTKSYGLQVVFDSVSFTIGEGERVGLVGRNGSGKTTLLDIISGAASPDSGQIAVSRGIKIGYLAQEAALPPDATILDEMLSARPEVLELRHRLDASSSALGALAAGGGSKYDRALEEYGRLLEEFEMTGGYAYDNAVKGALTGLGFCPDDFGRMISTLSGGQRTRLLIGKLLLAGHDLLMLDEPTNHLDVSAISWLEEFLSQYAGAVLLVSHDRYFLDKVAARIVELDNGSAEEYKGNFSVYRIEKEKRAADRLRQYNLMSERFEKEKEYINRMRAGVNARQAKGREKRLERFELPGRPTAARKALSVRWDELKRASETVLKAENITKTYSGQAIFRDVSFSIRRGERVGVVGRNGCGKSTLLKVITGEINQDAGEITIGKNVKTAYYDQQLEGLSENNRAIDELWTAEPMAVEQKIRDLLGVFLFSGDDALKMVRDLSGGEKGRLAIAKTVLSGANFLVLDEPTNHLDIPSREALEEALSNFGGTVLAVSHDRFFLDRFAEKIFELSSGSLTEYCGNYSYFAQKKQAESDERATRPAKGRQAWEERKLLQADERKRERDAIRKAERITGIEREIEELEAGLSETEGKLADPAFYLDVAKVNELTERYSTLKDKRDELYDLLESEVFDADSSPR
ncbi:MAG: ATP-binding cassette domain-containing protein [Nitrospirota bacterium]